ncbi:MAG TPA: cation-transporting P-type ATPase, partial [Thermoplasmata archaeon]|nr:cation-transporting P-type ATPase [Thermoplasmata archaeon]
MASSARTPTTLLEWARADLADLSRELNSGPQGLSADEARSRLRQFGPNELPSARKPSIVERLVVQIRNLFNVLLFVASGLSFVIGIAYHDAGSLQMGFVILGVVIFNIVFNLLQERRAEKVVEALRRLIPSNAKVVRDGLVVQVPVAELVLGDVFQIEEGDRVPVDARLLTSFRVTIDQSILTGESSLRERAASATPGAEVTDPTDCPNLLLAGTTVTSGTGTALVLATGANTVFGRIVATTHEIKETPSPLQLELGKTAKLNFVAAFAVGLAFLLLGFAVRNLSTVDGLLFMIAVIIDLVPEGLQITVTLALVIASVAMSRRKVVVKRLAAVETLGSATVICTDKTGTITAGQMTVRKIWMNATAFDVTGEGYNPQGQILHGGKKVSIADRADLRRLCEIAAFDNTATLTPPLDRSRRRWTAIGDTTDAALLAFALKGGFEGKSRIVENPRIALIPFDSSRKMMTSVHRDRNDRVLAFSKGAAQVILERSSSYLADGREESLTADKGKEILDQAERLAGDAFRVLALAYRALPGPMEEYASDAVEIDLTFVGLVAIYDPPRPDVAEAVLKARGAGIRVIMMTGDHEATAQAIARRVGILTTMDHRVMTGAELNALPEPELARVLEIPELVFARISPDQKHRIVKALRAKHEIVAVTGDGVNDAPALAEADVGIAMGITGTDVARETADMVLLDDNFASIVAGVELGRGVFDNLKKFLIYVFTHNWAELMSFVAFVLLNTPLAIGVIQVLAIDLIMEIPTSLALTVEPPEPRVMERQPRGPKSRLFDMGALLTSAYIGVPVGIVSVLAGFAVWSRAGWSLGMPTVPDPVVYAQGVAVVFTGIMMGQMGNVFAQRSHRESAFSLPIGRNKWLIPGMLGTLSILLLLIYVPFFQSIVGTAFLPPIEWAYLVLIAPMVVVLEEVRKVIARRAFPVAAVRVPTITPGPALETGLILEPEARGVRRVAPGFRMGGAPVVLALSGREGVENAIPVALSLAAYSGSALIVTRVLDEEDPDRFGAIEEDIDRLARQASVSYEFQDVRITKEATRTTQLGAALRRIA